MGPRILSGGGSAAAPSSLSAAAEAGARVRPGQLCRVQGCVQGSGFRAERGGTALQEAGLCQGGAPLGMSSQHVGAGGCESAALFTHGTAQHWVADAGRRAAGWRSPGRARLHSFRQRSAGYLAPQVVKHAVRRLCEFLPTHAPRLAPQVAPRHGAALAADIRRLCRRGACLQRRRWRRSPRLDLGRPFSCSLFFPQPLHRPDPVKPAVPSPVLVFAKSAFRSPSSVTALHTASALLAAAVSAAQSAPREASQAAWKASSTAARRSSRSRAARPL